MNDVTDARVPGWFRIVAVLAVLWNCIGVYFYKDSWYALKDVCPHAGVSLVVGPIHDGAVMCVGHGWRFKLASGELVGAPPNTYKVATFPVRVVDGKVEVSV